MRKGKKITRLDIVEAIEAGNAEQERELTRLLSPIDRRLTVKIFNIGPWDYTATVGRDGQVTHQPGKRFWFGVTPKTLYPHVEGKECGPDFESNYDFAMESLHQELARTIWNYFYKHADRVEETVNPLGRLIQVSTALLTPGAV